MTLSALLTQAAAIAIAVALAPLLVGWVNQCRAWLQSRTAPPLLQPYRMLRKLLHKDAVLAESASPLFRTVPYVVFGCMLVAAGIIPSLGTDLPAGRAADAIALVGLFATARLFSALGAMDVGTAFGSLGARREMLIGFLAEPALLMVLFNLALIGGSTAVPVLAERLLAQGFAINPSLAFAALAFVMVLLAENARLPIDNPVTHLELTMIHEAMVLEYSARHLALIEWAAALKLFNYACLGFAFFVPAGLAGQEASLGALLLGLVWLVAKLALAGAALALFETLSAKLRVFRAPEFLAMAFMLAVVGLLTRLLFSGGVA
ncbi:MAG: NADH-quinone oxidoreductase subunit H [Immundisolibacter sp.]